YQPLVPVVSFYSKEKRYLTPLERKQLKEKRLLRERSRDENLPAASRTEKVNSSRSPSWKPPKQGKTLPKNLKKAKGDVPPGKPSVEKENVNTLIKKKMDSPFRVLSMTVKPALRLQLGAAFFTPMKKSHSKKPLGEVKSPQGDPKSLQENARPPPPPPPQSNLADKPQVLEAGRVSRGISVPRERGNTNREDSASGGNPEGALPRDGRRSAGEIGSNPGPLASPSNAVVYPIFSAPPGSKKRTQAALGDLAFPTASNPSTKTPHSSQKSKKAKELCRGSRDQMIIDAGQKHFGAVVCKSCGMIYTAGSPEDEAQHIQHHERFLEALRYVGWKKERVVAEFWDGKIVLILPDDPKYAVKKAEDVREIVDNELGFKQVALSCPAKTKIYLFVSNEKMIVGCLVAESIKQVCVINCTRRGGNWRLKTGAICVERDLGVLTPLEPPNSLSSLSSRSTFMYGCVLSTQEIAFSDPTPDGKLFATKYCQTPSFLVYNFLSNN
ncbi:ESCO2 acetyltransferase, partial [Rostratula benghalensis]|nr:ESCO2 acetyltransferase [Rostratula benghalensis]